MKKQTKIILSVVIVAFFVCCVFVYLIGHAMAIEDHYGDLQDFYYQAETGDLIINLNNRQFGLIKKDAKRMYVTDSKGLETDLYNWVYMYKDFKASKNEVYRSEEPLALSGLPYEQVVKLIHENEMELVIKN